MAYLTRQAWGAALAKGRSSWRAKNGICFHWAGGGLGIESHDQCMDTIKRWQAQHMAPGGLGTPHGGVDLAYNFVACEHGFVFEGRGPNNATGANGTSQANNSHLAICYMGGIGDDIPPAGYAALREAVELAVAAGFPRRGFGHRDFTGTACCGDVLYGRKNDLVRFVDVSAASVTPVVLPPPNVNELGANVVLRTYADFVIELDGHGNGWRDLPVDRSKVISITQLASNPPKENYWNLAMIGCQAFDGQTRIVATEGHPKGFVNVTVVVAE